MVTVEVVVHVKCEMLRSDRIQTVHTAGRATFFATTTSGLPETNSAVDWTPTIKHPTCQAAHPHTCSVDVKRIRAQGEGLRNRVCLFIQRTIMFIVSKVYCKAFSAFCIQQAKMFKMTNKITIIIITIIIIIITISHCLLHDVKML